MEYMTKRNYTRARTHISVPSLSVAIVGGGAAGLMASLFASGYLCIRNGHVQRSAKAQSFVHVDIFESQKRTGKPILATGAGRCNITNAHISIDAYYNSSFVHTVFGIYPAHMVRDAFHLVGLGIYEEDEGRCYPVTNKATSVVDVLRASALASGVREICTHRVETVVHERRGWTVVMPDTTYGPYACVIDATGGHPYGHILPDGVHVHPFHPVLAPLELSGVNFGPVNRLRSACILSCRGHHEVGEAMFFSHGISGIAAFNISRIAHPGDTVVVNLAPWAKSRDYFVERAHVLRPTTWNDMCRGIFLPRVAHMIASYAQISLSDPFAEADIPAFVRAATHMSLTFDGIANPGRAQVHRGGVDVSAIDPASFEILSVPKGLYAVGECVDVDGPCGGFNLHWAWTSGIAAGSHIFQTFKTKDEL